MELALQTIEVNESDSSVEVCVIFTMFNLDELECNVIVSVLATSGAAAGTFYSWKLFRSPLHRFIEGAACAMPLLSVKYFTKSKLAMSVWNIHSCPDLEERSA